MKKSLGKLCRATGSICYILSGFFLNVAAMCFYHAIIGDTELDAIFLVVDGLFNLIPLIISLLCGFLGFVAGSKADYHLLHKENVSKDPVANDDIELVMNFKELVNAGIISQEEFDAKKKQLLKD